MMDYWRDCISESFEDAGIKATDEQINTVTSWVEGANENYGTAHGHECIPNPLKLENDALRENIEREREKEICPECKGKGSLTVHGPIHSGTSGCWKCRGEGFIYLRPLRAA
jgi:hypothetical protein